ncbi:MAG: DUF6438 domain-containing protein [Bacteroidota bacterium]|nr:DUF6438 domain-containing protein [Bacteroidota bacterium]
MKLLSFFSFLLVVLLFTACKDREPVVTNGSTETDQENGTVTETSSGPGEVAASDAPVPNSEQKNDSLAFSIERGACFGKCPFYRLHVYKSGFATYEGLANMEKMGFYHGQVGPDTLQLLVAEAEKAGFFEMNAEYDRPVTDIPSTTISVRRNGELKKVKGRVDPPQAFKQLATRVEEILLPMPWRLVAPQE